MALNMYQNKLHSLLPNPKDDTQLVTLFCKQIRIILKGNHHHNY